MRIELLALEGCPNREPARELIRAGMASLGIEGEIQVTSVEQAEVHHLPEEANRIGSVGRVAEGPSHTCCTPLAKPKAAASCPACGMEGKPVKSVTLRSLLQPHLILGVRDEVYHFCASPDCALVYYSADGTQSFARADLTVRVGVKERSAPRPLCYCFGRSAESIQEEWRRTGKSTVLDSIKAEVKAGTCHCEITNPGGGCCLGDITKEVKPLLTEALESPSPSHDCCAPSRADVSVKPEGNCTLPSNTEEKGRRTVWTSIGLGVLASACCWLPPALAGVGVATGTLGAQISWIRPWALGALLILLLGVPGWWLRKRFASSRNAEDCCAGVSKFPTLVVMVLLGSFALAWAAPRLLRPARHPNPTIVAPPTPAGSTYLVISTPQFDCPSCVGSLPQTMGATPGVASVQMDLDKRETHIVFQREADVDATLAQWKKDLGIEGKEVRRERFPAPFQGNIGLK